MWGVVNGNYAGINASLINPSSIMHSRLYLDVNVATADIFLENNALYIHREDYRPLSFLRSGDKLPEYGKDDLPFDYYRNKNRKDLHLSARVQGPSFSVARRDDAFGFSTAFRTVFSARDIPYEIIPFAYEGLNFEPQHNINYNNDDFLISGMSWSELGFTYAHTLSRRGPHHLTGGITASLLLGFAGFYLDMANIDYIVNNDSTLNLRNARGGMAYSPASWPADRLFSGRGVKFDLGITYEKKTYGYSSYRTNKLCKQPYEDYHYRLGISLLDLGAIAFSSQASRHQYDDVGAFWMPVDTVNFTGLDPFTRMLSEVLYGDPGASLRAGRFSVPVPAAASVQFDYHYLDNWYLNATVLVPLHMNGAYLYRPAQLSVTPRYETQYFELNVPVSLYDFRYPRMGVSARIWFLTLGTDNLLGFLNLTDFTGFDLYVSVKFNFLKGRCRRTSWGCDHNLSR
jgi:hypothetical protein